LFPTHQSFRELPGSVHRPRKLAADRQKKTTRQRPDRIAFTGQNFIKMAFFKNISKMIEKQDKKMAKAIYAAFDVASKGMLPTVPLLSTPDYPMLTMSCHNLQPTCPTNISTSSPDRAI
jgi:hypothetical protein